MSKKKVGKAFDAKIFMRILSFAKNYKTHFITATVAVIITALLSAYRPYLLKEAVNDFTINKNEATLLDYTLLMFIVLIAEVLLQVLFIYFANWIGQHIIRDIRAKVFRRILQFKMGYFDTTSVGKLVTLWPIAKLNSPSLISSLK